MTRWGATENEARARLLVALEERSAFPVGQWAAGARLREIVPLWQADLDASTLAPSTGSSRRQRLGCTSSPRSANCGWENSLRRCSTEPSDSSGSDTGHSQPAQLAAPCPASAPPRSTRAPSHTTRCATPDPSPVTTLRYAR